MDGHTPSSAFLSSHRLESLPSDVWDILASDLHSCDIIALWKCGSAALSRNLASTVRSIHLEDDIWHSTSRFPKFILQLRNLRHLSIAKATAGSVMPPEQLSSAIQLLSPTLETLELNIKGGLDALICYDHNSPHCFVSSETSSHGIAFIDLGKLFPRLRTLSANRGREVPVVNSAFGALPATLTTLLLPDYDAVQLLPYLPRGLTRLSARFLDDVTVEQLSRLPRGLTHLSSLAMDCAPNLLAALPRTLTQVDSRSPSFFGSEWTTERATAIPPRIKYINIAATVHGAPFKSLSGSWCLTLPRHLTWLHLPAPTEFSPSLVADLPRTLTKISGMPRLAIERFTDHYSVSDGQVPLSDSSYDIWPPLLASIGLQVPIHPKSGVALPRLLSLLPPTIRELDIQTPPQGNPQLRLERFPEFRHPHALTKLHVTSNNCIPSLSQLPPTLLDLSINLLVIRLEDCILPAGLTRLELGRWNFTWFKVLPRSLTDLRFMILHGLEDCSPASDDLFQDLPPHLQALEVRSTSYDRPCNFSGKSFSTLSHLTSLRCSLIGNFPPTVLKSLARGLKTLRISLSSIDEADVVHAPPYLTEVSLGHAQPTPQSPFIATLLAKTLAPGFVGPDLEKNINAALVRSGLYPDPRILD